MDDLANAERKIDRILQSQDKGIRGTEQTLANLNSVLEQLGEPLRNKCLDYLFDLLVQQTRQRAVADPTGMDRRRRYIGLLFKVLLESGRVDTVLCKMFAFFDVDNPDIVNNWMRYVFQEMTSAVYAYSNDFSQAALETLKAHVSLFLHPGTDLARAMPALSPYVGQLNGAIESAEFSRFEQQIRSASPVRPTPNAPSGQPTPDGLSLAVVGAMKEASEYLRGDGPFNPKKAADLMRTSIDESHRELVGRLGVVTGTPYTGADKDGARRAYLRKVGFISEPEERFFSAIYTLLSEEASHKLIAPRETMLVMEQTVQSYLLLLIRRLSGFSPSQP